MNAAVHVRERWRMGVEARALVLLTAALLAFGLAVLYSASAIVALQADLGSAHYLLRQVTGLGVGVVPGMPEPAIGMHVVIELFLPEIPVPCRLRGIVRNRLDQDGVMRLGIQFDAATLGIGDRHQRVFQEYLKRCREAS